MWTMDRFLFYFMFPCDFSFSSYMRGKSKTVKCFLVAEWLALRFISPTKNLSPGQVFGDIKSDLGICVKVFQLVDKFVEGPWIPKHDTSRFISKVFKRGASSAGAKLLQCLTSDVRLRRGGGGPTQLFRPSLHAQIVVTSQKRPKFRVKVCLTAPRNITSSSSAHCEPSHAK